MTDFVYKPRKKPSPQAMDRIRRGQSGGRNDKVGDYGQRIAPAGAAFPDQWRGQFQRFGKLYKTQPMKTKEDAELALHILIREINKS